MEWLAVCCVTILATSYSTLAYVDIPEDLKNGKMKQYASCRSLFSQNEETSASIEEDVGNFKKICTCRFYRDSPHSRLGIDCRYARETVLPISAESYRAVAGRISHFVAKQRLRGAEDEWKEQRVEVSESPEASFDLELGADGADNIYEIKIEAVLSDNSRFVIISDQISSNSGRSVAPLPTEDPAVEESRRESMSFSMVFNEVTENSISATFTADTPSVFRTEYFAAGGRRRVVNFNANGQARITGLQPNTKYFFIISHYRDGSWMEIKRKPVRTREAGSGTVNSRTPSGSSTREVTFNCPIPSNVRLQTIRWYKLSESGTTPRLIAIYDARTGRNTYTSRRDSNMKVINGVALKVKNFKQDSTARYNCRYSAMRSAATAESESESSDSTVHEETNDACVGYECGRGRCEATPQPTCLCDRGFTGDRCDIAINYCDSNPCVNGGTCNPFPSGFACQCSRGFSGVTCELSACSSDPCQNGGLCVARKGGGFVCRCSSGYIGPTCQRRVKRTNPCDSRPCVHGTCIALDRNSYRCACDHGYMGQNCQTSSNPRVGEVRDSSTTEAATSSTAPATTSTTTAATLAPRPTTTEAATSSTAPATTSTTTAATLAHRPSSGGQAEKFREKIRVAVYGPTVPVKPGSTVYLICVYPKFGTTMPTITWKKGDEILYSQKMPTTPSQKRITMTNQRQLRITHFGPSDAGAYECGVEFEMGASFKTGMSIIEVTVAGAPDVPIPPPKNLVVKIAGPDTAIVTWQPPTFNGITKYIVRYYPSTRRFGAQESREVTAPRIVLHNLEENNEYNVEVTATNGRKNSEPLRGYFEQAVEKIPPPTDFNVQMLSPTQAKVAWSKSDGNGISGYKVQYWDVSRPAAGNLVEKITKLAEMILSDLIRGKTYQVWIQAMKGDSLSPPLSGQFVKTAPPAPNAPAVLEFVNVEKDEITVRWDAPEELIATDKYRVLVESMDEQHILSQLYEDVAGMNVTASDLHPGVPYMFTVNTIRSGILSTPVEGTTRTANVMYLAAPYPDKVNLQCQPMLSPKIYRVKWYRVDESGKHLILTALSTYARNESIVNSGNGRLSAPSVTSLTITDVRYPEDFGKYTCEAAAAGQRTGSHSTELLFKYPRSIAPPFRFEFKFSDDSSAKITWRHPYPEDITSFSVRYWPTSIRYGPERNLEALETEAVLSNLTAGTEYQVVIKAKVSDMISDDSLVGQFINFAQHVRNVRVERLPDRSDLRISWENPAGMDGTLFSLRESEDEAWNVQPPLSPDRTSRRIRYPMNVGDIVYFKISTLKNNIPTPVIAKYTEKEVVGIEETEEASNVRLPENKPSVPDPGPPAPISNLRVNVLGPSSLTAVWDSSPDVYVDFYRVATINVRSGEYEIFNVSRSYLHVTRLQPHQTYKVTVQAVRNGSFSDPVSSAVTPKNSMEDSETSEKLPDAVPRPTGLRFDIIRKYRFRTSWDRPRGDVVSFEVRYKPVSRESQWNTIRTEETYAQLTKLKGGTEYDVQIYSINLSGRSAPLAGRQSTLADVRAKAGKPPSPIVSVARKTTNSITLQWNPQSTEHFVRVKPIRGSGEKQVYNLPRDVNSVEVTGLLAGRKYRAVVNAIQNGVKSPPSTVYATTSPARPNNVEVRRVNTNSLLVSWAASTSRLLTGYEVTYLPAGRTDETKVITISAHQAKLADLEPETVYDIQVKAIHGEDLSEAANLRAFT